ncbi:hypothetical protein [Streptomyces sp. NPDC002402]
MPAAGRPPRPRTAAPSRAATPPPRSLPRPSASYGRLRELAECDGGELLPGRTEADAVLFEALTAPLAPEPSAAWDWVIIDSAPGGQSCPGLA